MKTVIATMAVLTLTIGPAPIASADNPEDILAIQPGVPSPSTIGKCLGDSAEYVNGNGYYCVGVHYNTSGQINCLGRYDNFYGHETCQGLFG